MCGEEGEIQYSSLEQAREKWRRQVAWATQLTFMVQDETCITNSLRLYCQPRAIVVVLAGNGITADVPKYVKLLPR